MSILGDFYFFACLGISAIPAFILGVLERPLKHYITFISCFFIWMAVGKDQPIALSYMIGYLIWQIILTQTYIKMVKKWDKNRLLYWLVISLSLLPLIIYKLSAFYFSESFLGFLGISYMTFKSLQILIEIYDGLIKKISILDTFSFMIFFPSIVSGPIDRSRRFIEDINKPMVKNEFLELFGTGLFNLVLGYLYKMVIASTIYQIVIWLGSNFSLKENIIYMYSYGIYLFFDFAGYSLMAIGAAALFGVRLPVNFNKPFISLDMKEFWNRWHMSLSFWLRDFVFSRIMMRAVSKKWFNGNKLAIATTGLMANMIIMGVWHGLDSCYIIYGIYHGGLLSLTEIYQKKSKFYKEHKKKTWYKICSWFVTFNLIMFGFFIFSGRFTKIMGI